MILTTKNSILKRHENISRSLLVHSQASKDLFALTASHINIISHFELFNQNHIRILREMIDYAERTYPMFQSEVDDIKSALGLFLI